MKIKKISIHIALGSGFNPVPCFIWATWETPIRISRGSSAGDHIPPLKFSVPLVRVGLPGLPV